MELMGKLWQFVRRVLDRNFWICFGLCFLMAAAVFAPRMISGGGAFSLYSDYDYQQIPFSMSLHRTIRECGVDCWIDSLDLGTSSVQGYGFYELGSPFFWLMIPFPTEAVPFLMGWIYILKYAFAGAFAFLFLKRFTKTTRGAILGAIIYAFSGFQAINLMFGHFHDVVALFPLLMIGLERLAENPKKKKFFILMVALNCAVNYFFFLQEVVFLVLYACIRFWHKGAKWLFRFALRCLACGALGVVMAAAILLPNLMYISQSSRAAFTPSADGIFEYEPSIFAMIARGFVLPADAMTNMASIADQNYMSINCWLPMVGLSLVIAYMIKGRKKWLIFLLAVLIAGSFVLHFSMLFLLFRGFYMRWWYMLVLMLALACGLVLDEPQRYRVRLGAFINILMILAVLVWIYFGTNLEELDESRFLVQVLIALSGCILTLFFANRAKVTGVFIVLFAVGSTMLTFYYYVNDSNSVGDYMRELNAKMALTLPDDRYRTSSNLNVETIATGLPGMSSFSSTVSGSIVRFDYIFEGDDPVNRVDKSLYRGLTELLGGKYDIQYDEDGGAYFTEQPACPIGYAIKSYMTYDELFDVPINNRAYALLESVAVKEPLNELEHRVPKGDFGAGRMRDDIEENVANEVRAFSRVRDGYDIETDYAADEYVYFTIPNEPGWRVVMDGDSKIKPIDSAGMMIMKIPAGRHKITMRYHTPWYSGGVAISILAWLGFAFWVVLEISHGFGMRRR